MELKMQKLLFLIMAGFFPILANAAPSQYEPLTGTVQAGPRELSLDNISFTPAKDGVHILFDVYPYAAKIKALGLKSIKPVVDELLKVEAPKRFPSEKIFKLTVIELSQRDDYGVPRWDKMRIKERFEGKLKGGEIVVRRVSGEEVIK
jgi:hypothetical protein